MLVVVLPWFILFANHCSISTIHVIALMRDIQNAQNSSSSSVFVVAHCLVI